VVLGLVVLGLVDLGLVDLVAYFSDCLIVLEGVVPFLVEVVSYLVAVEVLPLVGHKVQVFVQVDQGMVLADSCLGVAFAHALDVQVVVDY